MGPSTIPFMSMSSEGDQIEWELDDAITIRLDDPDDPDMDDGLDEQTAD